MPLYTLLMLATVLIYNMVWVKDAEIPQPLPTTHFHTLPKLKILILALLINPSVIFTPTNPQLDDYKGREIKM